MQDLRLRCMQTAWRPLGVWACVGVDVCVWRRCEVRVHCTPCTSPDTRRRPCVDSQHDGGRGPESRIGYLCDDGHPRDAAPALPRSDCRLGTGDKRCRRRAPHRRRETCVREGTRGRAAMGAGQTRRGVGVHHVRFPSRWPLLRTGAACASVVPLTRGPARQHERNLDPASADVARLLRGRST